MPRETHLTRLLRRRDELAAEANRALAHRLADEEAVAAQLRDVEDLVRIADLESFRRRQWRWIEQDAAQLQAHLDGHVTNCPDCRRTQAVPA